MNAFAHAELFQSHPGIVQQQQEIAELTTRLSELEELQTEKTRKLNELQKASLPT